MPGTHRIRAAFSRAAPMRMPAMTAARRMATTAASEGPRSTVVEPTSSEYVR